MPNPQMKSIGAQLLAQTADTSAGEDARGFRKMDLETTAQYLLFEAGLYAIDFSAPRSVNTDIGLRLPAIRLEPLPVQGYSGRAFVSFVADGGWLSSSEEAAFVLVVDGQAGLILTVYKMAGGMPGPEIRIRTVGIQNSAAPAARGSAAAPMAPAVRADTATVPLGVLAHVQAIGDVKTTESAWAGRPGSNKPVEGFSVQPAGAELGSDDIEYQAVLGHNWNTPWFGGGQFCGSRGLALPLLGFRARLTAQAAEKFELNYWGSFIGAGMVGPMSGEAVCAAGEAPLEAMRFVIFPRDNASLATSGTSDVASPNPANSGPSPETTLPQSRNLPIARRRGKP